MTNHLNTQEPPPKLTESKLPNKSPLLIYLWLLILGFGALSMAIAAIAVVSLTNTGRTDKDSSQQTTIASQKAPTPTGGNWLPTIALMGAGVASTVAIYKWRHNLPTIPKRGRSRRQQRRLMLKQGETVGNKTTTVEVEPPPIPEPLLETQSVETDLIDNTPVVTVLPPEPTQVSSDLSGQSLAEMMDIRKHLSLSAILQDFKKPD
ncbi:hypothetical protein [Synechocystis sp. PCC 7509]|uniref:hypothetical protein n=1 Tax=Synechocystis sp. PCC 7509 TaxID=927677 RepID=UPI0002ACB681|nr:hypothetical protein [Synechocystis sp. PCC 7509]